MQRTWVTVEGNEAVANVAHTLSEVIAIYPITPSTPMGELADAWSAADRTNLWGDSAAGSRDAIGGRCGRRHTRRITNRSALYHVHSLPGPVVDDP